MAIKHLRDGQDFGPSHFPKDFGFHGSADGVGRPHVKARGGHMAEEPKQETRSLVPGGGDYARGGGAMVHTHPQGHDVTHVESCPVGEIQHHAHGGYTIHHEGGQITHHHADGMMAQHGVDPDAAQDKAMISKAIGQHETHEHEGEHTDLHLARGGLGRLPPHMRPPGMRRHSPIETPPRDPAITTTPRNRFPAGQMAYGEEPSAEPDVAGSEQGIPQLRHGGRAR